MAFGKKTEGLVTIKPPKFEIVNVEIEGNAPFVQSKFSQKARTQIRNTQLAGGTAARKKKEPRDFDSDFKGAQHQGYSADGKGPWHGIPCAAFRRAMIDACRLVGLEMTKAKMAVFVVADGSDPEDGTQLVKLISPEPPIKHESMVRNDNGGADIRVRPMWQKWGAKLSIRYDADILTADAVVNLLSRAGLQIGVGEGRPFSKDSAGMGWGTFNVRETK